ncbi:MAG: zinc-dependent metalloprotease [Chloroflexota bacterium]
MPNLRRYVGAGLLLGLAAGALWGAGRRYADIASPRLVNWDRVRQAAYAAASRAAPEPMWSRSEVAGRYAEWVRDSERLIAVYTGQHLPRQIDEVFVFSRADWIDANVDNFQVLFEPIEGLYTRMLDEKPFGVHLMGSLNQAVLSGQMGLMMGYMSQRVLGQYDMSLLGREPLTTGRLYFVEPNIAETEQRLELPGEQFRMWIALHETTHAYEFEAYPWLRDYMNNLMISYFETFSHDMLGLKSETGTVHALLRRVTDNFSRSKSALESMMSGEQRRLFRQMQSLMCLVEGFSNHVMDAVGKEVLPNYELMKERFEGRAKNKSQAERLLVKITGLDVKMEQYRAGEAFVNQAVGLRGFEFVNRVWNSPLNLPTLEEIYKPAEWISRMERVAA